MAMNRRDFIRNLALLAAGAAALPAQIEAFERYYDANTPRTGGPFIAVDELWLCGLASTAVPLRVLLHKGDDTPWRLGMIAFGGIIRQLAQVDAKLIAVPSAFRWQIEHVSDTGPGHPITDEWVRSNLEGHISYIDHEFVRWSIPINVAKGRLA